MCVFGLTGGIGSGKSAAAAAFRELGIDVLDADKVARDVVCIGSDALKQISQHFGPDILLPDQSLNRAQLRSIIFNAPEEKRWLENLLHPLIRDKITAHLSQRLKPYQILESPLLLETNQANLVQKIIVVDVDKQTQIDRASLRDGVTRDEITAIVNSQMPREHRLNQADFIINNNGSAGDLKEQVLNIHHQLAAIVQAKARQND
ncbi:dephospho-CoA kinase [Simiduia curdlanivorans]|uniref:Dephospho-CoA kinase n=1 Tax=Simiduia curdlanivorans TaxID=1492769 RepID=A0ABV8V6W8_9GAMM|nr:dephospho-CoA kinase [Simiduia curdlanivorans]MDN3638983.1 dephospho-CoA kinase [Simiduia curdlanivorans]